MGMERKKENEIANRILHFAKLGLGKIGHIIIIMGDFFFCKMNEASQKPRHFIRSADLKYFGWDGKKSINHPFFLRIYFIRE